MKNYRLKLKDKILIVILPVIIIAFAAISIFSSIFARRLLLMDYEKEKVMVSENVANVFNWIDSTVSKQNSNIEYDTVIGQLINANDILTKIRIFDQYGYEIRNGVYLVPTKESLSMIAEAKQKKEYESSTGLIDKKYLYIDLKKEGQTASYDSKIIEITFDKTHLNHILEELSLYIYAISLIVISAITVILIILSNKITEPIMRLSITAKRVASGEYSVAAQRYSRDEIGDLTDSFNSMVTRIQKNFTKIENQKNELERYSTNLESMVKERTIELLNTLEESKKTQQLLEESNLQFENLFRNMQEGFAIHEIICDESGEPVNFSFLNINPAYLILTGLSNVIGKTILEVKPEISTDWIKMCGRVALTGEPHYFDDYTMANGKHCSVNIYSPASGKFAVLFSDISSQLLTQEEIKKEKYILERILDETMSGYWDWNMKNDTEYLSIGFKKMLGYEEDELENTPTTWEGLVFPEDLVKVNECLNQHIQSGGKIPYFNEVRFRHKDGSTLWVIVSGHVVEWDMEKRPVQMIGSHLNITNIKKLEKSLSDERELLKATLMSIGDGVITTDKNSNIKIMNAEAERLTGWTQAEVAGRPFEEVFHIITDHAVPTFECPITKVIQTGKIVEPTEHIIRLPKTGTEITIEDSAAPIRDENGNINGAVLIFRDFTERKEKQKKIEYLSFHDQLTGLYNRRYLEEQLEHLDTAQYYPLSVVMLDVNGLKLINDAFGHLMGDKVLQRAANILLAECRENDIVARYGGDEFVILMPNASSGDVDLIFKKIVNTLAAVGTIGSVHISISFGWGTKQVKEERMADVFKTAEDHMYRRKLSESKSMHYKTVEVILKTLHEKSEREKVHSEHVSMLCELIGEALNLSDEDVKELGTAGLMHDIGKIAIDLSILDKPDQLNNSERTEIQRHPELGYQILRSINEFAKLAEYVLAHHERWDGTGYPGKLKGEEIPMEARIIAVADSYHAMICDRPYRKALSKENAMAEIKRNAGTQFDPDIAETFIEKVLKVKEETDLL